VRSLGVIRVEASKDAHYHHVNVLCCPRLLGDVGSNEYCDILHSEIVVLKDEVVDLAYVVVDAYEGRSVKFVGSHVELVQHWTEDVDSTVVLDGKSIGGHLADLGILGGLEVVEVTNSLSGCKRELNQGSSRLKRSYGSRWRSGGGHAKKANSRGEKISAGEV
jgi:hypothetical protein